MLADVVLLLSDVDVVVEGESFKEVPVVVFSEEVEVRSEEEVVVVLSAVVVGLSREGAVAVGVGASSPLVIVGVSFPNSKVYVLTWVPY